MNDAGMNDASVPLDNVFWHALTGAQARFAEGTGPARRFARGFSPILAFADEQRPDFAALRAFCSPGEQFYVAGWTGTVPSGWTLEAETTMCRMVWRGDLPPDDAALQAVPLRPEHADAAVALAQLTRPGPFGPRTPELGTYYGCFEGDALVAMAGERAQAAQLREISGVCTHPAHQGLGLARRLMLKLLREELLRGEVPFLHVMSSNAAARGLYERMGFRLHSEPAVRVIRFEG